MLLGSFVLAIWLRIWSNPAGIQKRNKYLCALQEEAVLVMLFIY